MNSTYSILKINLFSSSSTIRRIGELLQSPGVGVFIRVGVMLWLQFCVQAGISESTKGIHLKLYTCIRAQNVRSQAKFHNSDLLFSRIMPPFSTQKFWLKFCMQAGISESTEGIHLKLYTCIWGQNVRSYAKFHNSDVLFSRIMPPFYTPEGSYNVIASVVCLSVRQQFLVRAITFLSLDQFAYYMALMFSSMRRGVARILEVCTLKVKVIGQGRI